MNKNIKVLHVVAGDLSGGAARGALWLHEALVADGIQSKMLINSADTLYDQNIETILSSKWRKLLKVAYRYIDNFPTKFYKNREKTKFSSSIIGYNVRKHKLYCWADIIHFHWINGGFINVKEFKKIKKPIVWTMRDMWPFTGGCHYSLSCDKYKVGCGKCPQLGSKRKKDLSNFIFYRKNKYLNNQIHFVGISPWLSNIASQSKLLEGKKISTIYNGINCKEFFPVEKHQARKILGIETDKKIILVGAQNIDDFYKGFELFFSALEHLDDKKFFIAFMGKIKSQAFFNLSFEYKYFGFLNDSISLRLLYSAADVFLAPSRQEAFGKTIIESMACGTPVVCFNTSGPSNIVDHKVNGYKAKPFETMDLAEGIDWVVFNDEYKRICCESILKVHNKFNIKNISLKYLQLYKRILLES